MYFRGCVWWMRRGCRVGDKKMRVDYHLSRDRVTLMDSFVASR